PGPLKAQLHNPEDVLLVVITVILKCLTPSCKGNLPAEAAAICIGHKGDVAWVVERKYPPRFSGRCSKAACRFNGTRGKACKILFICDMQFVGIGFGKDIFSELQF